jgi:hypothetical protein
MKVLKQTGRERHGFAEQGTDTKHSPESIMETALPNFSDEIASELVALIETRKRFLRMTTDINEPNQLKALSYKNGNPHPLQINLLTQMTTHELRLILETILPEQSMAGKGLNLPTQKFSRSQLLVTRYALEAQRRVDTRKPRGYGLQATHHSLGWESCLLRKRPGDNAHLTPARDLSRWLEENLPGHPQPPEFVHPWAVHKQETENPCPIKIVPNGTTVALSSKGATVEFPKALTADELFIQELQRFHQLYKAALEQMVA